MIDLLLFILLRRFCGREVMNENSENGDLLRTRRKSVVPKSDERFDYTEIQSMLPERFDDLYSTLPLTEETTCGIWFIRGKFWQK